MDGNGVNRDFCYLKEDYSATWEANDELALEWWHEIRCVGTHLDSLFALDDRLQAKHQCFGTGPRKSLTG
jgi:hypothetical protein